MTKQIPSITKVSGRPFLKITGAAAAAAAVEAGGEIAHPPLAIPGYGTFAIYRQGGIDYGFWQQ